MDISTPLAAAPLQVLLALAEGPLHGYGILQAVRDRPGARVRLGTGSLYRHLARLIDAGLVAEIEVRPADPRRGSSYRLTPRAYRALAAERARISSLLSALDAAVRHARKGSM
jgi:DNA-binding PadR family transcriptional regulator